MKYYKNLFKQRNLYPILFLSSFSISIVILINYLSETREKLKEKINEYYIAIITGIMMFTSLYIVLTRDYDKYISQDIDNVEFNTWKDYKSNFLIFSYICLSVFGLLIYMWYDTSFNSKYYELKNYPVYYIFLFVLFTVITVGLFLYMRYALFLPMIEVTEYDTDRQQKINRIQTKLGLIDRIKQPKTPEPISETKTVEDVLNVGEQEPIDNVIQTVPSELKIGNQKIEFNQLETFDYANESNDNIEKENKKNILLKLGANNFI